MSEYNKEQWPSPRDISVAIDKPPVLTPIESVFEKMSRMKFLLTYDATDSDGFRIQEAEYFIDLDSAFSRVKELLPEIETLHSLEVRSL